MIRLLIEFTALVVLTLLAILEAMALLNRVEPPQQLPLVHADFRMCVPDRNGPIERPDHYNSNPHGRKKDFA
jgi:hypothetical protein